MMRFFLSIILITLVSCARNSKEYEDSFDVPLMTQNERLRLAGEYDSLVSLNKKFYKKADKIGYKDGKALCYINLAEVNMPLENYQKVQFFLNKAKQVLKNSDNNIHQALFYSVYGRYNMETRRFDKAFECSNEAMSFIKKNGESKLKNRILFDIYLRQGSYFVEKKNTQKALELFYKAEKLDDSGVADCIISDFIYMYKNKDSAYKYVSRAYEKMSLRKREDAVALYINTTMGEYYTSVGEYDKAEKFLLRALEIDKKTKRIFANYTKYIYNDFRSLYEKKGDTEKAYLYLNTYSEAINKSSTAAQKTINQDMESFIRETNENFEEHESHIRWVIAVSIIIFVFLGLYAWRSIKLLKEKKMILKTEAEELKVKMNDNKQGEIMELAKENDPEFLDRFKETYPSFINALLTINPDLENSELIFCAMLKLHFTSKEIASYTLVQHRSVQQKKYRIRKRLNIPTETDTYQFFDDLI